MSRFAAQLAANDREHVERLEAIASEMVKAAGQLIMQDPIVAIILGAHARNIRDEIARWKRPHPMGGE